LLSGILRAPAFVAESVGSALSALAGLSGQVGLGRPAAGTFLVWGPPLLVAAIGLALWRLGRLRALPPRVVSLLVIGLSFWSFTAITRGFISAPYTSRYLYVGGLVVLLLAAELARGIAIPLRIQMVLAVVAMAIAVVNLGAFRDAARDLRFQAQITRAQVTALDIGRPIVKQGFVVNSFYGIDAGSYFSAEAAMGTPAVSPAELATGPEYQRKEADLQLVRIHQIAPQPRIGRPGLGAPPVMDSVSGGSVTQRGGCVAFSPAPEAAAGTLAVRVPAAGLLLTAEDGAAKLSVRRFGDEFQTLGSLAASSPATLRIAPDRADQPWHLQLAPTGRATVCGLA
jgi:hypothetical protein